MKKFAFIITFITSSLLSSAQCYDSANVYSFIYNGHTYKVIKENKNWTEAAECAVLEDGYLVEINDEEEQTAILSELSTNAEIIEDETANQFGTSAVWIGGSDSQDEGTWIWDGDNDDEGVQFWEGNSNGNPVGGLYSNWGISPAEPDNSGGNQHKLTLTIDSSHPNFGLWNDLANNANNTLYYVIEYNTVLSIEENRLKSKIQVYPNPFDDYLEISSQLDLSEIIITNTLGQIIHSSQPLSNAIKLDLPDLNNGMYFLTIWLNDGTRLKYKLNK